MEIFRPGPNVWLQDLLGPGWQGFMETVSALGSVWGILLVSGIALWLWGRRALYAVLVVVVVEAVAKKVLATAFYVDRPPGNEIVRYRVVEGVSSFPSGHVSTATTLWAALGFLGRMPIWVAGVVGAAVAIARLYLGVHWLTDVVAGILLGLAMAWVGIRGFGGLADRLDRIPARAWAGVGAAAIAFAAIRVGFLMGDDPFSWNATGFLAGAGLTLPAERRFGTPPDGSLDRVAGLRRLAVGGAGIVPFFLGARAWEAPVEILGLTAFLATLWCFLGAPLVVARWPGAFGGPAKSPPRQRDAGGALPAGSAEPEASHG
ncbi:MAG TPA: phosphatase PAP2 family protein [Longimicrobiales bacterium]|nr:phosphatase PAP2 family protein [Longimicrobiales bacterium]